MKTTLFPLILHVALSLVAYRLKHLAEKILEILLRTVYRDRVTQEFRITDIKRSAILMGRGLDCIAVAATQLFYAMLRAKHTRHLQPVGTTATGLERVVESLP